MYDEDNVTNEYVGKAEVSLTHCINSPSSFATCNIYFIDEWAVNEERELLGKNNKKMGKIYIQAKFIPSDAQDDNSLGQIYKDLGPVNSKK